MKTTSNPRAAALLTLFALLASIVTAIALAPSASAATPIATVGFSDVPSPQMIGEDFSFTVTFDNTGSAPTDTGFGPYIDLVLPTAGGDGDGDGISFSSANYIGATVPTTTVVFNAAGQLVHPLTGLTISGGTEGDQLVVLQLPFGSFTVDQPVIPVSVTASLSGDANVNEADLQMSARGGFLYGDIPTGLPGIDTIVGSPATADVTPAILELRKEYLGPESETATGPSFPRRYNVIADIADGLTVADLELKDLVPESLAYLGIVSTGGGSVSSTSGPPVGVVSTGGEVSVLFSSATGTASNTDAIFTWEFFVSDLDASASPVLNAATGNDVGADNNVEATYDWTPNDLDDPLVNDATVAAPGPEHTLAQKSIAIQKGGAISDDHGNAGLTPGDEITYSLNFQVSDYFTFDDLIVTDVLNSGLAYIPDSFELDVQDRNGTTTSYAIDAGDIGVSVLDMPCGSGPDSGSTQLEIALSDAMAAADRVSGNAAQSRILVGGEVGGVSDATPDFAAATGTITFRADVLYDYTCPPPSGDVSIDQNDWIDNTVEIDGRILDNVTGLPTGSREADTSGNSMRILEGSLSKSVYAKNGDTGADFSHFAPGDTITYRLQYSIPSSAMEDFKITDYLPLPVLDADEMLLTDWSAPSGVAPPAGTVKFGATDTFSQPQIGGGAGAPNPALSHDSDGNSFELDYGTYNGNQDNPSKMDLLFTLTISDDPFTDGLLLTNQARAEFNNSFVEASTDDGIVQFILDEPDLGIIKGVTATDNPSGVFSPALAMPDGGDGIISSNELAAASVDTDISQLDAGDTVTFSIFVENTGSADAFDVTVADDLPSYLENPTNVVATRGDGTSLSWTGDGGANVGADLFSANGIVLDDPSPNGSLAPYSPTSGENLVVISFDATLAANTRTGDTIVNDADLTRYAGAEGAPSHNPKTDDATVDIVDPTIVKTDNGNLERIGDQFNYTVTMTVPEGFTRDAELVDTLDRGLAFVSVDSVVGSGVSTSLGGGFAAMAGNAAITSTSANPRDAARQMTIDLGDLTRTVGATPGTITVGYTVVVTNDPANNRTNGRNNSALIRWDPGTGPQTVQVSAPNITIIEPILDVAKTSNSVSGTHDAGDYIDYTITVNHTGPSNSDAHDVTLTDVMPSGMIYQNDLAVSGYAPTSYDDNAGAGPISATWTVLPDDGSQTVFTYSAQIPTNVAPGTSFQNTADIEWTSMPGSPAQAGTNTLAYERTGDASDPGGTANDHNDQAVETIVVDPAVLDKQFVDTSFADTTTAGRDVTIGEIVDFAIPVDLPESEIDTIALLDVIPSGTTIVGTPQIITSSSDPLITSDFNGTLSSTNTLATTFLGVPALVATWGDSGIPGDSTVVVADGDATNNRLVVRYSILVNDVATLNAPAALVNNAFLTLDGGTAVTDNETVNLVEPNIVIDKAVWGQVGDSDARQTQPGDAYLYGVTVTNNGTSPAWDIDVTDQPDSALTNVVQILTPAGTTVTDGWTAGDPDIVWHIDGPVAPGASVTFGYIADLGDVSAGSDGDTIVNTADVSQYFGVPIGERTGTYRTYTDVVEDTVTLTLRLPQPRIVKTLVTPGPAEVGQDVVWDITVHNDSGYATLHDVDITDTIPTNWEYVAGSATIGGTAAEADNPAADPLTWTNAGDIGPNGSIVLRITTRPLAAAATTPGHGPTVDHTNTAGATGIDAAGTGYDAGTDDADTTLALPVLTVTKTPDGAPVNAGGSGQYSIVVANTGAVSARGVVVTDTLGPNQTYTAGTATAAPSTGFAESSVTPSGSDTIIEWTIAQIPAAGSVTITVPISVPIGLANGTDLDNLASVVSNEITTPVTDPGSLVVASVPEFAGTSDKTSVPTSGSTVDAGSDITYTVGWENTGNEHATGVIVTDGPPANTVLSSIDTGDAGSFDCDTGAGFGPCPVDLSSVTDIRWNVGDVDVGDTGSVSFTVTVDDPIPNGTVITNLATITSTQTPGGTTLGPVDHNVASAPVLSIAKTVDHTDLDTNAGERDLHYGLVATNSGTDAATNVVIADSVPAGTTLTGIDSGGLAVTCDSGAGFGACPIDLSGVIDIRWSSASFAAYTQLMVGFDVQVDLPVIDGTEIPNTATVDSDETPEDPSNEVVTTVHAKPVIEVTKEANVAGPVNPGDAIDYSFTYSNSGTAETANARMVDPIPANTSYVVGSTVSPLDWDVSWMTSAGEVSVEPAIASDVLSVIYRAQTPVAIGTTVTGFGFSVLLNDVIDTGSNVHNVVTGSADAVEDVTAETTHRVNSAPTLNITKDTDSVVVEPSGLVSYTILVEVGGNAPASPLNVTDVLPDELDFVSADPHAAVTPRVVDEQKLKGGQTLNWTFDSVQPTETAIVEVTARLIPGPADGDVLTNTASATTPGVERVVDTEDVVVEATASVAIEKVADRAVVGVGDEINYTISVTNDGDGAALGIVVTDELPTTLDYVSSDPNAAVNGRTLTWQVGRMAPGEVREFGLVATANAAGTPINTATVEGLNVLSGSAAAPVDVASRAGQAQPPAEPSEPSGPLAYTGANLWWMMLVGAALAAAGLVILDRRRRFI